MSHNLSKALRDRLIEKIEVQPAGEWIRFTTDKGPITFYSMGDCCSYSWIESITGANAVVGNQVLAAEEIDLPGSKNAGDEAYKGDCLQVFGYKITTDKGVMVMDFRNESNGYYGGSLEQVGEGCYYGPPKEDVTWVGVDGDWARTEGVEEDYRIT